MIDGIETRLHVKPDLGEGATIGLGPGQAHYLRSVLRLGAGAEVAVFNGRDGEWRGRIDGIGKGWASITLVAKTRAQRPEPDVWIAFAPIKRARIDFVAQKATELGAARLMPVLTRRTIVDRVNTDRLAANAVEASEQTDRLTVPVVDAPVKLDRLLDEWPEDRPLIVGDETGEGEPMASVLSSAEEGTFRRSGLLIGPEGGFDPAEHALLRGHPSVVAVSLGPRLLRADTAALAMLVVWQSLAGDWRTDRPNTVSEG